MTTLDLDYLIIYQNDGTPVYSRCFKSLCKVALQNDVLFSAFLASLSTFAAVSQSEEIGEIVLEDIPVQVEYSQEDKLKSMLMEDLRLLFFYTKSDDYTIAAGFDADTYKQLADQSDIVSFLGSIETFLANYQDTNWQYIETAALVEFESRLIHEVIQPFFDQHDSKDKCPFGDNCPIRIAMYEGRGSIIDRLRDIATQYRNMNILRKIWKAMTSSPYKITAS